jgi:hypothetical protein
MAARAAAILGFLAAASGLASPATAGDPAFRPPPRGPVLGNNAWRGEIRDEGAPDRDLFAGPLAKGDSLSVEVRATAPSGADGAPGLLPRIAILDPSGAAREAPVRSLRGGALLRLRRLPADATGRWAVVLSGVEDSEGPYLVRFRVRPAPGRGRARLASPAPGGGVATAAFEAVRGSVLFLEIAGLPVDGPPPLFDLLDPHGEPVPHAAALLERRAGAWRLHGLSLDGPDGAWTAAVGLAPGEEARLRWRVLPPRRPRGTADLLPVEPRLAPRAAPLAVPPEGVVRLEGSGFSVSPEPTVLVDGVPARIHSVDGTGSAVEVVVPPRLPGTTAAVAVVNPDGQACEEPAYLVHLAPGAATVAGFLPGSLRLPAGGSAEVTVFLTGFAPASGTEVALGLSGGIGTAPATVAIPPLGTEGRFTFHAAKEGAEGAVEATLGRTLPLPVRVDPPPPPGKADLSGWTLVQTDSARSFAIPPGTVLSEGGRLLVTRDSGRAAFEAFWGVTLGSGVLLVDSDDRLPSFNGAETITLLDATGAVADGPTFALTTGRAHRRLPADGPAGDPASWSDLPAVPGAFLPGAGALPSTFGVRLAALADPPGTGNFVHEFVEISFAK